MNTEATTLGASRNDMKISRHATGPRTMYLGVVKVGKAGLQILGNPTMTEPRTEDLVTDGIGGVGLLQVPFMAIWTIATRIR